MPIRKVLDEYGFSKFVSTLVVLGLILSNAGSVAYAQVGVSPTPEPVYTELPPTEPPTTGSMPIEGQDWSQSGWFSIIWGDGPEGASQTVYTLTDNSGQTTVLVMNETLTQSLGGVLSLNRKYVSVQGVWAAPLSVQGASMVLSVTSISLALSPGTKAPGGNVLSAVIGSKPWVSIMCKFSDYNDEPKNLAYFQGMYANTKPGLDHYWRELSYGIANVAGSSAAGWFVLPHTEAYYNPTDTQGGTNLNLLAADCIAVADASVNFALYSGINMMFNTNFDNGYAWGGGGYLTLDGVTRFWSTTWEPPWAYSDISVIQHEMGHGFGLPHSSGAYGQTYDNAWDVMSKDRYNCAAATDPTYGCIGQHTISYHKNLLGWISSGQKFTAGQNISTTITLEQLALPQTGNYKMAQIPIDGSSTHFYTIEARRLTGYDIKLAGAAVIIHEVDITRDIPAHVIDADGNGNTADAGAMWVVGETFTDASHGISVTVLLATSTGFQVSINTLHTYTLTVGKTGTGQGAVIAAYGTGTLLLPGTAQLPLITNIVFGTVVTLTAVPNAPSVFAGWGGAVVTTTNPLVLTMTTDKVVTVAFNLNANQNGVYRLWLPIVFKN
jgi:M6 family metalloprotease-like protein